MTVRYWRELPSGTLPTLDPARAVAVLPLAATEQHGPHLPTGTDSIIAEGLIRETAERVGDRAEIVVLPVQEIGASLEHLKFAGTLSLSAAHLMEMIAAIGGSVAAAGLRKLVIVSSHGGNVAAMTAAALECRARHDVLAVTLTWMRLGLPDGLVEEAERQNGMHGGLIETSLMLHFRPDLVVMERAENFSSLQQRLAEHHGLLRAHGPLGFGWLAGDLNPKGTVGNAAAAAAEIGAGIAAHQAQAFAQLLDEIAGADVDSLLSGA